MSDTKGSNPNVKAAKSKIFAKDDLPLGTPKPKSMFRPNQWTDEVEEHYRFQIAGYKDEIEYKAVSGQEAQRWPHNNYVKRLRRRSDGFFYYYNKTRECSDKDINRTKVYVY